MITAQIAKQRINELIAQDKDSDDKSKRDAKRVLAYFALHFNRFYSHYNKNGNFTIQESSQPVDEWGINEWKDAISSFNINEWSDSAIKRLRVYGAMASQDKKHLLIAILSLGMINFSENQQTRIMQRLSKDGKEQLQYLAKYLTISKRRLNNIVNDVVNVDKGIWSERLWNNTDMLANQVSEIINKHLSKGISLDDLSSQLNDYANFKQFKNGTNLAGRLRVMDFNNSRLLRTESSKVVQEANYQTYKRVGVTKVDMVTQAGHCDLCGEIASDGPFDIDDAPQLPIHPNDRCTLIPYKTSVFRRIS